MSILPHNKRVAYALLADHSLVIESESGTLRLIESWLPLSCTRLESDVKPQAKITVGANPSEGFMRTIPETTLRLGSVKAWVDRVEDQATLLGANGCSALIDLTSRVACIDADPAVGEQAASDLYSMLTVSAALLLGRLGRVLIHAGAVVGPNGCGWIVVGDAKAGKSTTCVSLIQSGCDYLSDDQVVLAANQRGIEVEGWLRPMHLDVGWTQGVPRGKRRTLAPVELNPAQWQQTAILGGMLVTRVVPSEPTRVSRIGNSEAFENLVRQSPWLLADRGVADSISQLLLTTASVPRFALQLGLDTFAQPARLRSLLDPILTPSSSI